MDHTSIKWIAILAMVFLGQAGSLAAEESPPTTCPICRAANHPSAYPQKAGTSLLRGAINTAFGWTELVVRPADEVKAGGNLAVGIGKGMELAVKRTALGFGELATFWAPRSKKGYLTFNRDCPICMRQQSPPSP